MGTLVELNGPKPSLLFISANYELLAVQAHTLALAGEYCEAELLLHSILYDAEEEHTRWYQLLEAYDEDRYSRLFAIAIASRLLKEGESLADCWH